VHFLLFVIELISLSVTVEALRANIDRKLLFLKAGVTLVHLPPIILRVAKLDASISLVVQECGHKFRFVTIRV